MKLNEIQALFEKMAEEKGDQFNAWVSEFRSRVAQGKIVLI